MVRPGRRQCALALAFGTLAACSSPPFPEVPGGPTPGFFGGAAADEPRAALVAEAILVRGGTAADAAAALYFALTVTYPVAAGIGGGGVCVVYDAVTQSSESIEFLPRPAASGGPVAVPGAVRGIAALHARFGRLRWSEIVLPAEEIARFGHPVSRAFATGLADAARRTAAADARVRAVFAASGRPIEEGENLVQVELADTLGIIRVGGGGDFYFGESARRFVAGSGSSGGQVTLDDLRDLLPKWRTSAAIQFGELTFFTAPGSPGGAPIAAQMWAMLTEDERYQRAGADERAHLIAEVSARAYTDRAAGAGISAFRAHALMTSYDPGRHNRPPGEPIDLGLWRAPGEDGTTSFVVVDQRGSAVSCGLTMNRPLGLGRMAGPTGVLMAPPLPIGSQSWKIGALDFLAPIIIAKNFTGEFVFAGAASGGAPAPAAVIQTALASVLELTGIRAAIDRPRLFHFGAPDSVFVEPRLQPTLRGALTQRGHRLDETARFGRVNAIVCPAGISKSKQACEFAADGRAYGLGTGGAF